MSLSYYVYLIDDYLFYIGEDDNKISFITLNKKYITKEYKQRETPLIKQTKSQLEEYFRGQRKSFSLPLKWQGTSFQKLVWQKMQTVSYGSTLSYQALAQKCGNPSWARAIGNVCHNNRFLIVIPCHRIVAKNNIGGYAYDLKIKEKLLALEKNNLSS